MPARVFLRAPCIHGLIPLLVTIPGEKSGLNLAVGADYILKLGEDDEDEDGDDEGGLMIGVRAGYTVAPIKGDWDLGGYEISGGPDNPITGPYIRFMVGGGGMSTD